jgi:hypothetical protein
MATRHALTGASLRALSTLRGRAGVSEDDVRRLAAVAASSPQLVRQINEATWTDRLRGFAVQPGEVNAGATYHPDTRRVYLTLPSMQGRGSRADADLVFVLGHEVQHAVHRELHVLAWDQLLREADHAARHGGDYSTAIAGYTASMRWDEDVSTIMGWNAFVEHTTTIPDMTLPEMVARSERAVMIATINVNGNGIGLREGFVPNDDWTISPTPQNVEAMSRYYSGAPPRAVNIGAGGDADYPNYYGAVAVSVVSFAHRHALDDQRRRCAVTGSPPPVERPIIVRFAGSRQQVPLMESVGITLRDRTPLAYVDVSTTPPTTGVLRHTRDRPGGSPAPLHPDPGPARHNRDRLRTGQTLRTGTALGTSRTLDGSRRSQLGR